MVWENGDVSGSNIFGQRFDRFGTKIGGEFQLNTYIVGAQQRGDVAMRVDGIFLAVWQSGGRMGRGTGFSVRLGL